MTVTELGKDAAIKASLNLLANDIRAGAATTECLEANWIELDNEGTAYYACALGAASLTLALREGQTPRHLLDADVTKGFFDYYLEKTPHLKGLYSTMPFNVYFIASKDNETRNYDVKYDLPSLIIQMNDRIIPTLKERGHFPAEIDSRLFIADYLDAIAEAGWYKS